MKGLSPIIAMVLFIAITVIAGISVYYWVLPYAEKPVLPDTVYRSLIVQSCEGNVIQVKNGGALVIRNTNFTVYNSTGGEVAWFYVSELDVGETSYFDMNASLPGSREYTISQTGYQSVSFPC